MKGRSLPGDFLTAGTLLIVATVTAAGQSGEISSIVPSGTVPRQGPQGEDAVGRISAPRQGHLQSGPLKREISPNQPVTPQIGASPANLRPELRTYGLLNGRAWKTLLTVDQKIVYLYGINEAVNVEARDKAHNYFPPDITYEQKRQAIDRFYDEPENILIPVVDSVVFVTLQLNGTPQTAIDRQLSDIRRVSAEAPERKQGSTDGENPK